MKIRKAVIPAAGYGTRFLPATKAMPKEMLPVVDKPVIQIVVEQLVEAGIEEIIIVTGWHKRAIEDHFDYPFELEKHLENAGKEKELAEVRRIANMANFIYVRQKGPYGNGTPLLNVRRLVGDEPFIYSWADDFIHADPVPAKQLITAYEKYGASILSGILADSDNDYKRYGYGGGVEVEPGVLKIEKIVEKPGRENAPSKLANVSEFLFTPEIFEAVEEANSRRQEGSELYYNDALNILLVRQPVYAIELKNAVFFDTGNKLEYLKTVVQFGLKHPDINGEFRDFLKNLEI